jgi:carboxypeptidase Taq
MRTVAAAAAIVPAAVEEAYEELARRLAEIADLEKVSALLGWDQQTVMPALGAGARAHQRATITRLGHQLFTAVEVGQLLDRLEPWAAALPYDGDEASILRVTRREYEKERRVPADLAAEMSAAATSAHEAWVQARAASDFTLFRPHLEHALELRHRYIACFEPREHVYDLLLEDYEPGMTTADVTAVFDELKAGLVPLIAAISEHTDAVRAGFLHGSFDVERQRQLVVSILDAVGFRPDAWRLDTVVHPFATSSSATDVRITTRYHEDYLPAALFGALHEFGHGLYEAGIPERLERTPAGRLVSLGLHESQSRLWENLVGRGRPFWRRFYGDLQAVFPEQLGSVERELFYRAINRVQPSLIRVEADEATYNLHIVLRFELEQELVTGRLAVDELPEAWNARMRSYLGIEVPDDAQGVLQDPHWCFGFGYFPTYTLGNMISAQLWTRIRSDLPTLDEAVERGDFAPLRAWLRANVHELGSKLTMQEALERIVGERLSPQPYLRYLEAKLGEIYGL